MPSNSKVVRQWFTVWERGLATALARSGAEVAQSCPAGIRDRLADAFILRDNWFYLAYILAEVFRNIPQECSWLPDEERELSFSMRFRNKLPDKNFLKPNTLSAMTSLLPKIKFYIPDMPVLLDRTSQ